MQRRTAIVASLILLAILGIVFSVILLGKREKIAVQAPLLVQERPLVTYTEGECFYKEDDSAEWSELETGTRLYPGTNLKTGQDGRIDIRLNRESRIRMGENTLTNLDNITVRSITIDHREGRLYAKFHKMLKDQSYTVETDHATCGIRGTELVFDTNSRETVVYALSGITEVSGSAGGDPLLLSYNSWVRVPKGQNPEAPRKMKEEVVTEFRDRINSIHSQQILHISHRILFEPNSARMIESSREELVRVYELIEKGRYTVEIAGHTALVGDPGAMYALSLARAEAIRDELILLGVRGKRLDVQGYGATRSLADNDTEEGRALNRRVEFAVVEP